MDRLFEFYFTQHSKVWLLSGLVGLISFCWAAYAVFVLQQPESHVYLELGIAVPLSICVGTILWSQLSASRLSLSLNWRPPTISNRRFLIQTLAAGAAAAFSFVLISRKSRLTDQVLPEVGPPQEVNRKALVEVSRLAAELRKAGATSTNIKPIIQKTSTALAKVQKRYPSSPAVWKYSAEFINYKFASLVSGSEEIRNAAVGRACVTTLNSVLDAYVFSNCEKRLEDVATSHGDTIHGHPPGLIFTHCLVKYDGGELPEYVMTFQDCVFEFNIPNVPPANATIAIQQLTAADPTEIVRVKG